MAEVVIAWSEADARAVEAVRQHHAELAGALRLRVEQLMAAAAAHDAETAGRAGLDLVDWCGRELVPHARAEEQAMYPAARATAEGRLLVEAMLGEHAVMLELIREVADAGDPVRAAALATALCTVFDSHVLKENELVLPLLASVPGVSVTELVGEMHQHLGEQDQPDGGGSHSCTCGEADGPEYPELDARDVPHAIRHATVLGALGSVRPGGGLILIAPHDPLPLLRQVNERWPGVFTIGYQERGPEAWRLTLHRPAAGV